ncbi:S-methyl-5-thioribose-1-phosphate isomerase [Haliangium sp.]|uniref:S-methyl-5-thioribose-1-phosphate isomerase n=1 Tax=Haliangium sp. TaxID=2663208 RepID=UPI003D0C0A09
MNPSEQFSPLRWEGEVLHLIDQRLLPGEELWIECRTDEDVFQAIRTMIVRGAPAIGCAAAYGVVLAGRRLAAAGADRDGFARALGEASDHLAESRPTAVNLFWALDQMRAVATAALAGGADPAAVTAALAQRAVAIHADDIAMCRRIGKHGAALIPDGATVLTHCNAGALATGGYGTALGVIRAAREAGKSIRVIADETRPYLQGARLTAWELLREGFDVTVIPDGAAAALLARGEIQCCVVGADRIAANGDVANKIGTYGAALAANAADVPFYVAVPVSTIDLATASGADIPIEERDGHEVLTLGDHTIAPKGARARYPAFDITPAALVSAIVTDTGVVRAPYQAGLAASVDTDA